MLRCAARLCRAPALVARSVRHSGSSSSIDDALRAAVMRAADSVEQRDPLARRLDSDGEDAIAGVQTAGPKMLLRFTCTHDDCTYDGQDRTTTKVISKNSYENGIVLVRCSHCENLHLIADRLGWFGNRTDVEEMLATRGEEVRRMLSSEEAALLHIE